MKLLTIDKRFPITIVVEELLKSQGQDGELFRKLKAELIALVIEVAQKFTGFSTVESIKKSLDISLGIISFGMLHYQNHSDNDDEINIVVEFGFKDLAKKAISAIKELAQYPEGSDNLFKDEKVIPTKELIKQYALFRSDINGIWKGYDLFLDDLSSRKNSKAIIDLAKWLIQELSGNLYEWKEQNRSDYFEDDMYPIPDQIINNFLFRFCNDFPTKGKLELSKTQFKKARNSFESDKENWLLLARAKYDSLVSKIPEELQSPLVIQNKDWFERHFQNGPVIVPKGNASIDNLEILWPYIVREI